MKILLVLATVLFLTAPVSGGDWYTTIAAIAAVHKNVSVITPEKPKPKKPTTKTPPARRRVFR